jgi:signal transduction histidine kinase
MAPANPGLLPWLVLGNLLVIALVGLLAWLVLSSSQAAFKRAALGATDSLARSMVQSIEAEIGRIDISLQTLVLAHADLSRARSDIGGSFARRLAEQRSLLPMVDALEFAVQPEPVLLEAQPGDGLLVAGPVLDPASNTWRLLLARRVDAADGSPAGVVHASVPTEHFRSLFAAARPGPRGAITLRTTGLQLVARYSERAEPSAGTGTSTVSAELREALRQAPRSGSFVATTALDQIERVNAYRQVGQLPLLVLVGLATDDYLSLWRRERLVVISLVLLVVVVLAASSRLVYRAAQRDAVQGGALVRDQKARRKVERALAARKAELEREQALRAQAEAHARELDILLSERSEMLDVMAHEVRQPLNNASAALQAAARALADAGQPVAAARLERAQRVLGQVLSSIDNNLAVAALLAGSAPIERVDTDIDLLTGLAVGDMPAEERARIRVERLTSTRTASMDLGLMRLALRNLLANALAYSPPGSLVSVLLLDSDEPLAFVVEVCSAGAAIVPALVPRLFERGSRGGSSPRSSSHGLGLYIVHRVMSLHRGEVLLSHNLPGQVCMRLVIPQAADD